MNGFTKCPNCVKKSVIIPLRVEGNSMVCSFCESIYEIEPINVFH